MFTLRECKLGKFRLGQRCPLPGITLGLLVVSAGLMLLPLAQRQGLYLNTDGSVWHWITGHWVHADAAHWYWNAAALLILGTLIEQRSKGLLLASVALGMAGVNLLLRSPLADIQYYCGLSGVLNTLLGVVLVLLWQERRHPLIVVVALLSVAKIALEIRLNAAVFTHISVASYPLSHAAGLLATPLVMVLNKLLNPTFGHRRADHSRADTVAC